MRRSSQSASAGGGSVRYRQVRLQEVPIEAGTSNLNPSVMLWSAPGSRSESPPPPLGRRRASRQSIPSSLMSPPSSLSASSLTVTTSRLARRRSIRDTLEAIETGRLVPPSRKQSLFAAYSPATSLSPLLTGGTKSAGSSEFKFGGAIGTATTTTAKRTTAANGGNRRGGGGGGRGGRRGRNAAEKAWLRAIAATAAIGWLVRTGMK